MQGEPLDVRASKPKPGDILAGKYRIEGLIGAGGMGAVYAARNLATGKRVALKWVLAERATDQELLTRFQREARAAGRIDHPNVVSVYDVGQHGPSTFLVMELLNGQPLSNLLKQGPLPQDVAIGLIIPALRGISAAHDHGVIHRDLKPDNIFLCMAPDGSPREAKVLDFGVSKLSDEVRVGLSVTKTGAVVGTPYYMSPEQVRGMRDIDHRIDVYAMGVILYEMLTRRPPFVADSYSALVVEIATGSPPPLLELRPDLEPGLVTVIERAMAREREHRYPNIEALARDLEPFGDGTKFRPDRPEWTARISTGSGAARTPIPDYTEPDADPFRSSRQDTVAAEPVAATNAIEEAVTAAAVSVDAKGPEEPAAGATRRGPRAWWIAGVAGAVLLAIVVALALGGDEEADAPAQVATEPTSVAAEAEAGEAVAEGEGDSEAVAEVEVEAANEGEGEGDGDGATGTEAEATTEAANERVTERAAGSESERSARRRTRPMRRTPPAMEASEESMETAMRRGPRAGTLSIEDF